MSTISGDGVPCASPSERIAGLVRLVAVGQFSGCGILILGRFASCWTVSAEENSVLDAKFGGPAGFYTNPENVKLYKRQGERLAAVGQIAG